jgi:hypothetical protein
MPRHVDTHHLEQKLVRPRQARTHLCGGLLIVSEGPVGGRQRSTVTVTDPDDARTARDDALRAFYRRSHLLLTHQQFTVSAVTANAAAQTPQLLDEPFMLAWSGSWAGPIGQLDVLGAGGDPGRVVSILPSWPRLSAHQPWGPALESQLRTSGLAVDADSGLALAVTGTGVAGWLGQYYAPTLVGPIPHLPADLADDSDVLAATLRLWQPRLDGPLSELATALRTARDLVGSGVPVEALG